MELINATRMTAGYNMGLEPSGRELLVVVIKGTFRIPQAGDAAAPFSLHEEQLPLVMADTFTGAPGLSAPVCEVDFVPRKPRCDILLNGSAYAPPGRLATRASPTVLSVVRFRTRPKAPSASCWQTRMTVRWKKDPCSFPWSRINWPWSDDVVSGIRRWNMRQTCPVRNLVYSGGMKKIIILVWLGLALAVSGCKSSSGSREYVPGQGWNPND